MRAMFGAILLHRLLVEYQPLRVQPYPQGLAKFVDLTFFGNPRIFSGLKVVLVLALLAYALDYGQPIALAYMLFMTLGVFSLVNSQGGVYHSSHVVTLVVLGQLIAHVQGLIAPSTISLTVDDLAVHYSLELIAATYVVAGLSKVILSRGTWAWRTDDLALKIVMSTDQHFYQREGKTGPGLDDGVRRASLLVDHPYLARVAFTGALATELFAFLVLFGRVPAFVLGCGLIFMHVMIEIVMEVPFRSSIHVLLVFAVNVPYLLTLAIDLF
jgi:hypothetical protein